MCNSNKITICTEFDAAQIAGLQVPIASIHAFATQTVPDGYLICDGSAISRTEYAELFAALGTVWGAGDEVATFNIPDLRGEFMRGFDAGRGVDVGRVFGSSQEDEFKEHVHEIGVLSEVGQLGSNMTILREAGVAGDNTLPTGGIETRPRNVAITYAIKAAYPTPS
ncbi:MAG: phage tail protein [Thalassospira sp.]|uniref:phage tail protein n=1 Tax=Thalassospira sp. TaxID=1912094 RepID=UPI0032EEA16F